jgi:Zn-dependent peptidase ImmA (M78 family)
MELLDIETFGLLRYVVPEKIDIGEYDSAKTGVILPNGLILINGCDSLEEQVKTVLHEIIHMHPEFISYTGGLWENSILRNEEYENRIEQLAQQIYARRKDIVKVIIAQIKEARTHPLNSSR